MSHADFCEDAIWGAEWRDLYVGIVSDGCSSGEDSYFASALTVKLFRLALRKFDTEANLPPIKNLGPALVEEFYRQFKTVRQTLDLSLHEVLATALFLIVNPASKEAWILAIGDGLWAINGDWVEIDQNNTPHYPAYDLQDRKFDAYAMADSKSNFYDNVSDVAVSTDGVMSFIQEFATMPTSVSPRNYLLIDKSLSHVNQMLVRKFNILKTQYGFSPQDDVGIIRIIF